MNFLSLLLYSTWGNAPPLYTLKPMYFGQFWEYFNIILWSLMVTSCYKTQGKWTTLKIFGIGLLYGMVLENGGPLIIPELGFEGYFWEEMYQIYLFEFWGFGFRLSKVPLATHLGWCNVFYMAFTLYQQFVKAFPKLQEGKIKRIIIGFLIMTSSGLMRDLQLDPLATRFQWWIWNENLLPVWFGVPLINYIAWFWAVGVFGGFWVFIHHFEKKGSKLSEKDQTKMLFFTLPFMWGIDLVFVMLTKAIFNNFGFIYL